MRAFGARGTTSGGNRNVYLAHARLHFYKFTLLGYDGVCSGVRAVTIAALIAMALPKNPRHITYLYIVRMKNSYQSNVRKKAIFELKNTVSSPTFIFGQCGRQKQQQRWKWNDVQVNVRDHLKIRPAQGNFDHLLEKGPSIIILNWEPNAKLRHYWLYRQYWANFCNVGGNRSTRRKPTLPFII